jgi:hypothetical protein
LIKILSVLNQTLPAYTLRWRVGNFTWSFLDAEKTKIKTFHITSNLTVNWENIAITETALRYTEYYTIPGTSNVSMEGFAEPNDSGLFSVQYPYTETKQELSRKHHFYILLKEISLYETNSVCNIAINYLLSTSFSY